MINAANSFKFNNYPTLKVAPQDCIKPVSFQGKVKVYALSDSHQETSNKCKLLSHIIEDLERNPDQNIVILDNGDIFEKGYYPKNLEIDAYIQLKKLFPQVEIIVNIGNGDIGKTQKSQDYAVSAFKKLAVNGINVLSANIVHPDGRTLEGVKPYAVIQKNGDKVLVLGFCCEDIVSYGMKANNRKEVFLNLKDAIKMENPDSILILNHDHYKESEELLKYIRKKCPDIKIQFVIGGHHHGEYLGPEIYHPGGLAKSMFGFELDIEDQKNRPVQWSQIRHIYSKHIPKIHSSFGEVKAAIDKVDEEYSEIVAPRIVDLKAPIRKINYTGSSSYGTFVADYMRKITDSEIAFISQNSTMRDLPELDENSTLTKKDIIVSDIRKSVFRDGIEKVFITADELKETLEHSLANQVCGENLASLSFSQNIKIVRKIGKTDERDQSLTGNKIVQIYINDKPILDEEGKAINPKYEYSCAIDSFFGSGFMDFDMLPKLRREKLPKQLIVEDIVRYGLKDVSRNSADIKEYPSFEIEDIWIE